MDSIFNLSDLVEVKVEDAEMLAKIYCEDIEAVKNDLFEAENQGDVEAILEKHSENFDEEITFHFHSQS